MLADPVNHPMSLHIYLTGPFDGLHTQFGNYCTTEDKGGGSTALHLQGLLWCQCTHCMKPMVPERQEACW